MRLHIKSVRWAINRVTGKRTERVTANVTIPCQIGELVPLSSDRHNFTVDEITDEYVKITVHYFNNPDANKTITVENDGTQHTYAPRSFGAGSIYYFTIK